MVSLRVLYQSLCSKSRTLSKNWDNFLIKSLSTAFFLINQTLDVKGSQHSYKASATKFYNKLKTENTVLSTTFKVMKLFFVANYFFLKNKAKVALEEKTFLNDYSSILTGAKYWFIFLRAIFYNNVKYTPIIYYNFYILFFTKGNILWKKKEVVIKRTNVHFVKHLAVFYKALKSLLVPVAVTVFMFLIMLNYGTTNLLRQLSVWLVVGLIFFWLISGFNFFLKRYRFGKFTSAIQRFWKRANSYFWLIEGFLFSLFFYYYLNSSQEPLYYYDESNLNQTHLFSLTSAYISYALLVFLIFYSFFLLLNLPNFNTRQQMAHLTLLSLGMIYIYLIESYQFYYVLTTFIESFWLFDAQSNTWVLEFEVPRLRAKHQYLLLALIAKYWHFLFIFLSWLFFAMKSFEQKRIYYVLFGVNIQNLIILFGLNILFYVQWLKWIFRRFYDAVYYWFFTDPNGWSLYLSFNAVYDFFLSVVLLVVFTCDHRKK